MVKSISTPIAIGIILISAVSVVAVSSWQYSELFKQETVQAPVIEPASGVNPPVVGQQEEEEEEEEEEESNQEKCENSGGKWIRICDDCVGCPCIDKCDCTVSYGSSDSPRKFRIEKDNKCFDCSNNQECGSDYCAKARNVCIEYRFICENGVCSEKQTVYGSQDQETHSCVDINCVKI